MNGHLSPTILTALADGELQTQELVTIQEHLAGCAACTGNALAQALLKSAITRAGQRYTMRPELAARISREIAVEEANTQDFELADMPSPRPAASGIGKVSRATAASILALSALAGTWFLSQRDSRTKMAQISADNALVSEAFDQHVTALAATAALQVLSSDNHTVKPWFQGKLPFAFNLPDPLPDGTTLDGANLTYLRNQPAAQLLFSIGKHRVSVFVVKGIGSSENLPPDHAGFHVMSFASGDLEGIAVSDVNPARLAELVRALEGAQNRGGPP